MHVFYQKKLNKRLFLHYITLRNVFRYIFNIFTDAYYSQIIVKFINL